MASTQYRRDAVIKPCFGVDEQPKLLLADTLHHCTEHGRFWLPMVSITISVLPAYGLCQALMPKQLIG